MKFQHGITLLLLAAATVSAQTNTYPWPASGNVGIGTTSPAKILDVNKGSVIGGGIQIDGTNDTRITIGSGQPTVWSWSNGWATPGDFSLIQENVSGSVIYVKPGGNVGIGTTNPNSKLTVNSALVDFGDARYSSLASGIGNGVVLNADAGGPGTASVGIEFGGNGVAHANLFWKPNERQFVFGTGNYPTDQTNPYGYAGLSVMGNVGIGTTNPTAPLHINSSAAYTDIYLSNSSSSGLTWAIESIGDISGRRGNLEINRPGLVNALTLTSSGNVGIGTYSPTEKLSVNGRIRAKEVIVETSGWSDHVFADSYQLQSLAEVEQHIKTEKHLPGVPSASEVANKGVSVGDMQAILLAKIEELTLHVIAQEKHQAAQEKEIARLRENEKELATLRAEVQQLRQPQ